MLIDDGLRVASDKFKHAGHRLLHRLGIGVEFCSSARTFLGGGRGILGDFVHLADRSIELFGSLVLFSRGGRYLRGKVVDLPDPDHDFL